MSRASSLLWTYYENEDIDKFRRLLSDGRAAHKSYGGLGGNTHGFGSLTGSPSGFGTSATKQRKVSGQGGNANGGKSTSTTLSRAEINSRDHAGLTILHRAASSSSENAISFALALLEQPSIDLYVQDKENGWTALHRALYFGNITLARAIIEKDNRDPTSQMGNAGQMIASSVIKVKDFEGNSPFDVYNATIARRSLQIASDGSRSDGGSDDNDSEAARPSAEAQGHPSVDGDEVFAWGSSRNHGLGFKDQDDRQHPEKINLKRPDHLLFRFYREYVESVATGESVLQLPPTPKSVSELPTLISNRPIVIQDVTVSKLHSAILTTDPESNLYMCGFGPSGRLGTGDETTRFSYTPIEEGGLAGKKVVKVALGQNHSLAVTSEGSLLSWGINTYGQLGYTLPRPALKDEEPFCATPRQIFGPLKRETIIGIAASDVHSVAHTSTSLFTWGKNEGQLGLMDSDSRSFEIQPIPRRVAASLFKAPIYMVSAINTATVILLSNYTVFVFVNYGYTLVKFPLNEGFTNYHLQSNTLTTRYESGSNHISHITAGGDTIGALSSRGDLFTVTIRSVPTSSATSTTNPSKMKDSLSPQRVWSLRKGNWDGVKSVGITENGSVIVCTQAGAVWRRIKRAKIKDAFVGTGNLNRKDFKFQRVPGLTKVAAVRSTTFGVYAAIRKDCDVTRSQILVDEQRIWDDLGPLLSIRDLEASEPPQEEEGTETPRYWSPALPKEHFEPLKRAVLTSADLEHDVSQHLKIRNDLDEYDAEIGSTSSEVFIPVHGFMLARSPVLRKLLKDFCELGARSIPEILIVSAPGHLTISESHQAKTRIVFQGLDFITVVNLAVYLYTDSIVDVWHFTTHSPWMSFRYRQVRLELMKIAGHLRLNKLENAVRLMTGTDRRMNVDLRAALNDPDFFSSGDTIIELDGSEVVAHSALLSQRCPFFQGLFHGRAEGQWLAGRRENDGAVRIDMKHIRPDSFQLVLSYLYADVGTELFDNVVSADIDEFSELVLDVMMVADELMLDRLSQICQQVIGRFVTTRNVCQLLNLIAPCSVTGFKNAALEYLCLQLESILENHLLSDLDDDLLLELDNVVRANQLNCLPFAKSGRAELLLHERHPSLAEDITEERQRRLRDMTFRANLRDDESRLSSSYRARIGSMDDLMSASPTQDRSRRKSKAARNAPFSPSLRPKDSTVDLMFNMDEDEAGSSMSPSLGPIALDRSPASPKVAWNVEPSSVPDDDILSMPLRTPPGAVRSPQVQTTSSPKTWSSPVIPSSKLDMREIMAQASSTRTSNLSMSITAEKAKDEALGKQAKAKISQKERKKQQQQNMQQMMSQPQIAVDKGNGKPASPWQIASKGTKTSLKDVLDGPKSLSSTGPRKHLDSPGSSRSLTPRRTASPDTRFSGQARSSNVNIGKGQSATSSSRSLMSQPSTSKSASIVPHSKSYTTPAAKAEPSLQLSMADIIGQQRREQEVIKEAVAKRSLQEIQEEQAFQEWWDQESRRAQEEEAARSKPASTGPGRGGKSGGRGRGGRGRGDASRGRGRGRGQKEASCT